MSLRRRTFSKMALLTPTALAIVRVDQCVAFGGVSCVVLRRISTSFVNRTVGVRPPRGGILEDASHTIGNKLISPCCNRPPCAAKCESDAVVLPAFRSRQHDLGPQHDSNLGTSTTRQLGQRRSFFFRQHNCFGDSHIGILPGMKILCKPHPISSSI